MEISKYQVTVLFVLAAVSMIVGAYMGWFIVGFYCAQALYTLANRDAVVKIGASAPALLGVLKNDRVFTAAMLAIWVVGVAGSYQIFTIWQFAAFYSTMLLFVAGIYVIYHQVQQAVKTTEELTEFLRNTVWSATEVQDALQQIAEEDYDFEHQVNDKD